MTYNHYHIVNPVTHINTFLKSHKAAIIVACYVIKAALMKNTKDWRKHSVAIYENKQAFLLSPRNEPVQ